MCMYVCLRNKVKSISRRNFLVLHGEISYWNAKFSQIYRSFRREKTTYVRGEKWKMFNFLYLDCIPLIIFRVIVGKNR